MTTPRRFRNILIVTWLLALGIAFSLDRAVAEWVKQSIPIDKHHHLTKIIIEIVKLPGWFPFTLVVAALVGFLNRRHWHGAIGLALSGIAVGAAYSLIKWTAGRHRPVIVDQITPFAFHPFPKGIAGLFNEQALCFPSGHASLAFATAASLIVLLPRWGWAFFPLALAVGAERVLENAHYVSDVVAGAGMGTLLGWLVTRAVLAFQRLDDNCRPDQSGSQARPSASTAR